jgi:hypothetical protein
MTALRSIDIELVLVWGLVATVAMSAILEGARRLHWSRMSLPFVFGAAVTGRSGAASAIGFVLYVAGGWLFAFLYAWLFEVLGRSGLWLGVGIGVLHGVWLLVVFLPLLAEIHPRMATARTGLTAMRRLEPPGLAGLNYGTRTPLVTMVGQAVYGGLIGFGYAPG